jgi:hypothetical protein
MRSVPIQTYTQDDVDEEEGVTTDVIDAANATIRRRYFMRCAADCPGRGRNALTFSPSTARSMTGLPLRRRHRG